MAEAVIFTHQNKIHTIAFSQQHAVLPIKMKSGAIKLVAWGKRENENSEMPLGGWARLTHFEHSHSQWNMYQPKLVHIPVQKFMEKTFEGKTFWYEMTKGQCIQGLLAKHDNEYRLYIVTIDPQDLLISHYRWPHIIADV